MSTFIHGIAASENIDSSGEVVSIEGMDISSLDKTGIFNFEHDQGTVGTETVQLKVPSNIVGKILKAIKIFSEQDCQDDYQKYFWSKCQTPYLYVMGELLDDYSASAKEVAGKFQYDLAKKGQNEHNIFGFSIEGAKLDKQGSVVTASIARKVTITVSPCNKACIAEIIPAEGQESRVKDDLESIFKTESASEIELFKSGKNDALYEDFLRKKEDMGKSLSKAEGNGWINPPKRAKDALHYEHPTHGTLSIHKTPGGFDVRHNGAVANLKGVKGSFKTPQEAGQHAKAYMSSVSSGQVATKPLFNRPSPNMVIHEPRKIEKTLEAGSGLAAPAQLTQGAALGKEDISKKLIKEDKLNAPVFANTTGKEMRAGLPGIKAGAGTSHMGSHVRMAAQNPEKHDHHMGRAKEIAQKTLKNKSKWLARAEEAYQNWSKREQFVKFMQEKLPNLHRGEIDAIGKTLALKKSWSAEQALDSLINKKKS